MFLPEPETLPSQSILVAFKALADEKYNNHFTELLCGIRKGLGDSVVYSW